jgi:hypothetical protein
MASDARIEAHKSASDAAASLFGSAFQRLHILPTDRWSDARSLKQGRTYAVFSVHRCDPQAGPPFAVPDIPRTRPFKVVTISRCSMTGANLSASLDGLLCPIEMPATIHCVTGGLSGQFNETRLLELEALRTIPSELPVLPPIRAMRAHEYRTGVCRWCRIWYISRAQRLPQPHCTLSNHIQLHQFSSLCDYGQILSTNFQDSCSGVSVHYLMRPFYIDLWCSANEPVGRAIARERVEFGDRVWGHADSAEAQEALKGDESAYYSLVVTCLC